MCGFVMHVLNMLIFFFSSRRRHTSSFGYWSSDVCSSDLGREGRLPCFVCKGFPTFRSHLRMRPVSRRHSRRGLVGGSTFCRTPISRSPLDKNPMTGHVSELHPVNEVNTKGQFFRASFGKNPRFQIQLDKRPLSPGTSREASGVPC